MADWTFITNHGAVLALVGKEREITAREVAARLQITERSVMRIIRDLEDANYITVHKIGRLNSYQVHSSQPLRRPETREVVVGDLLNALSINNE